MYMIDAVVREEKYEEVMTELSNLGINGITLFQVMGWGQQKGFTEHVRSTEIEVKLVPKIMLKIAVTTEEWRDKAIEVIKKNACTDHLGDGKIFTYQLDGVVRIRTGETGFDAL